MSITKKHTDWSNSRQALFEELEARYGSAVAQGIIDQIDQVEAGESAPDYMAVKAYSEMLEVFRDEAQTLLRQLRARSDTQENRGAKITFLDQRKLEAEFRRIYRLYWVSMKLYYPACDRALADCRDKIAHYGSLSTQCAALAA